VALVTHTHAEAFPDMAAIGWDVALLEDGPCLIEGNKRPDLDLMQMGYGAPFGNARLGELLAFNLCRAMEVKYGKGATEMKEVSLFLRYANKNHQPECKKSRVAMASGQHAPGKPLERLER
jgi:hypothetical protein